MGKTLSVVSRPFKNYDVQSRAHKLLDAEKPRPAPRHPSDKRRQQTEKGLDAFQNKDDHLVTNLKSVYVVTQQSMTLAQASTAEAVSGSRPLPSHRRAVDHPAMGYVEPDRTSPGKVSLAQAVNFIMEHQNDPEKVTAKTIADQHDLDEEIVSKVLQHFSAFELHVPAREEEVTVVQRMVELPKMLMAKAKKESGERT